MQQSCDGQTLNLAAVALASALAEGLTAAQTELLAAFFNVLADSLGTLAITKARRAVCETQ